MYEPREARILRFIPHLLSISVLQVDDRIAIAVTLHLSIRPKSVSLFEPDIGA